MTEKARIAILTNFMEFNPGYSLTGIVLDQMRMLIQYGHEVHLFVNSKYYKPDEFPIEGVHFHPLIPFAHLKDYRSESELTEDHHKIVQETKMVIVNQFKKLEIDIAFTHDFVFQGWFMPYGLGVRQASPHLPDVRWLHWIHSVPTVMTDWWQIKRYGSNHKIVFPNATDRLLVAEQYRGTIEDVRTIHHIKDMRSWMEFDSETCDFINQYPAVMQADVVKIYPASVDRLSAKKIRSVINIMAEIKKQGKSVCFVVANQWATTNTHKESVKNYYNVGATAGLVPGKDFIFTSDFKPPKYEVGIPARMVRELFSLSNLFIFATREESFGLVLPEAALAGGVLTVCNKSLGMLKEVAGNNGLFFDFGSFQHDFNALNEEQYHKDLAFIITGRMKENESLMAKTFMRKTYNWDRLYREEYAPVFAESKLWNKK